MNTYIYTSTPDFYNDYIQHYNHNHDPRNGQFTTGPGGGVITSEKQRKKIAKKYKKYATKSQKYMYKKADSNYVKAYNEQTKFFNEEIAKINKKYENGNNGGYDSEAYEKEGNDLIDKFDERVNDYTNYYTIKDLQNYKYYQEAQKLIDMYGSQNISSLAVDNESMINDIINNFEKKYKK